MTTNKKTYPSKKGTNLYQKRKNSSQQEKNNYSLKLKTIETSQQIKDK